MSRALTERAHAALAAAEASDLRRRERVVSDDTRVWCGNDYLGLRTHPAVIDAARHAADAGFGSGGSRLVSGTTPAHVALEQQLATWLGDEASLLFGSGWSCNVGLLSATLGEGDVVVSDALNHASLIDGIRLTRARRAVVAHGDVDGFRRALIESRGTDGLRLVVVESVYSMDGDLAPLGALAQLCADEGAALYVDEAHALGVLGESGRGLAAALDVADAVDARVGTCGKALGGFGAFVTTSQAVRDWWFQRARSFVFSTAPPLPTLAATSAAVELLEAGEAQARLWRVIGRLRDGLADLGWWRGPARSAIFPLVVGEAAAAVALSSALDEQGMFVQAIRPPTVPPGTARLRVTASAARSDDDVDAFVDALARATRRLGLTPRASDHGEEAR